MTIYEYLAVFRRRWRALVVGLLVGVAAGLLATVLLPKSYDSTATLFVRGVPGSDTASQFDAARFANARARSYPVLARDLELLNQVIDEVGLDTTAGELESRLSVENPVDTSLVNVTVGAATPQEAQQTAEALAEHLADRIVDVETSGGSAADSPVDVQIAVPAELPGAPSSPQPRLNLVLGALGGTSVGLLAALFLDRRVRRVDSDPSPADERADAGQDSSLGQDTTGKDERVTARETPSQGPP